MRLLPVLMAASDISAAAIINFFPSLVSLMPNALDGHWYPPKDIIENPYRVRYRGPCPENNPVAEHIRGHIFYVRGRDIVPSFIVCARLCGLQQKLRCPRACAQFFFFFLFFFFF